MKNNHYLSEAAFITKTIQKIFYEKGSHCIPDIKLICSITNANRETVLRYLQEWWLKQDFGQNNQILLSEAPDANKSSMERVHILQHYLDSLIHELELHADSMNYLPKTSYPFANYLIQSFLNLQNKLNDLLVKIHQTEDIKNNLETQFKLKCDECARLDNKLKEVSEQIKKKTAQIKCDLKTTQREADALRTLVRSLKKDHKYYEFRPMSSRAFIHT